MKIINFVDFVTKANLVHKNKFKYYCKEDVINFSTKISITCPAHGKFKQTARQHLSKLCACPQCYFEYGTTVLNVNFIKKAQRIHYKNYSYLLVNYVNADTNVKVICPVHDVFEITPREHLVGIGCPTCAKMG